MGKSTPSNVAERIAQFLREKGKDYLTINQIRDGLPTEERERLGFTKQTKADKVLGKLKPLLGTDLQVYRGSRYAYIGFRQPLAVIIFNAVAAKPGKTAGQLAQVLPMVKKEFIQNLNRLLADGDLICRLNQRYTPYLDPPARGRVTAPAPRAAVAKEEPEPPSQDIESDRVAFKVAYDAIGSGRSFVRIHRVREHLGWSRERFDALLVALAHRGTLKLHQGDPSDLTENDVRASWEDEHGFLYITFTWRGS